MHIGPVPSTSVTVTNNGELNGVEQPVLTQIDLFKDIPQLQNLVLQNANNLREGKDSTFFVTGRNKRGKKIRKKIQLKADLARKDPQFQQIYSAK